VRRNSPKNLHMSSEKGILNNTLRRIVESTGARMFGLDDAEVTERRRYVGRVRREIQVRL
jgi:hypothetical protein